MINSEVTKNLSKFFYISYVVWKIGVLTKDTENSHFWLKIHRPQQVCSWISRYSNKKVIINTNRNRKMWKASKHAKKHFFFFLIQKKMHFFTQISERSICMHLHHSDLDSGGQRYPEITKKISAYAKTTCWWKSSRATTSASALKEICQEFCNGKIFCFSSKRYIN